MPTSGQRLRLVREQLGYTLRDVESASMRIAERHKNDEYAIPLSRLSDIETKGVVPSIFRVYSLAVIYRLDVREILVWFGVDVQNLPQDLTVAQPPKTHRSDAANALLSVQIPIKLDPSFDLRRTFNLGRMIEKWGLVPLAQLSPLANSDFTYGYIGSEDYTMYPLILPGAFVQIDESKNEVIEGAWRSEYERPVYFVETRAGYSCCWCNLRGEDIVLQPHPLSPEPVKIMRHPQEAEVIGQVVGVAMRLDRFCPDGKSPETKVPPKLN